MKKLANKKTKKWYKNENIKESCFYKHNKIDGVRKLYYSNGELRSISRFSNGKLNGISEFFYYSGNIKRKVEYKNHKKHGSCISYYITGHVFQEYNYVNNRLSGVFKTYHDNGELSEIGYYKNNKLDGVYKSFTGDGSLLNDYIYLKGKLHGICKTYFLGKIANKNTMYYGKKNGECVEYYPSSEQIRLICNFKNDKKHGKMEKFNKEGKLVFSSIYSEDDLISTIEYDPIGNIVNERNYQEEFERLKHK